MFHIQWGCLYKTTDSYYGNFYLAEHLLHSLMVGLGRLQRDTAAADMISMWVQILYKGEVLYIIHLTSCYDLDLGMPWSREVTEIFSESDQGLSWYGLDKMLNMTVWIKKYFQFKEQFNHSLDISIYGLSSGILQQWDFSPAPTYTIVSTPSHHWTVASSSHLLDKQGHGLGHWSNIVSPGNTYNWIILPNLYSS